MRWQSMDSAPKDAEVDLWVVPIDPRDGAGMRITNCVRRDASYDGRGMLVKGGWFDPMGGPHWERDEGGFIEQWATPTHWMFPPLAPDTRG